MKMELRHLMILGGAVMVAGVSSVAFAGHDPVIYDNGAPDWLTFGSPASQLDLAYPFDAGAADDFMLGHSGQGDGSWNITDVHWSGVYFGPGFPGQSPIASFNIIFWADVGGIPDGGGQPDGSLNYGVALANYNIVGNANETLDPGGDGINQFNYSVDLPVPFVAAPNTSYWVEVQPVFDFPPQWAFQRTFSQDFGAPAQQGFFGLGIPFWVEVGGGGDPMDLSFSPTGTPVPAPGALALLGVAGLAGMRRRRRK